MALILVCLPWVALSEVIRSRCGWTAGWISLALNGVTLATGMALQFG